MDTNKISALTRETRAIVRTCSVCGRKGKIELANDGKVLNGWAYFGEINTNSIHTDKYYHEVTSTKPLVTRKIPNEQYNEKAKPKLVEYWECPSCFAKPEQSTRKIKRS